MTAGCKLLTAFFIVTLLLMTTRLEFILKKTPTMLIIAGVAIILFWSFYNPTAHYSLAEPGRDGYISPEEMDENIVIGEHFERFAFAGNDIQGNWPRFRGSNSDNIHHTEMPLINSFNDQTPEILWSVGLGEGHAGAAIYDGVVYLLDYDEDIRADMLRSFCLETGEELWRRWYNIHIRRNHGMSRTVPAVTDEYIVTIGPRGHVMCVERKSGEFLWGIDIEKDYESNIPLWYTGQCPIIDEGVAIIATGGKSLMIGVDCATGEIVWETPNPDNWEMSHSSIMPFEYGGRKMYVYSAIGGIIGVAANGHEAGTVLWKSSEWNHPVVAPSPVCMPDGKIFLTAGYGAGSMLLQLHETNGVFNVEVVKNFRPGAGLSSEQQTPVYVDGHLFGILPNDARTMRNQFVCVNPADPTVFVWTSGQTARFGLGPYMLADDKFYLLNDDATLIIVQKNINQYIELDRIKLFDGFDAWAPLAIADGYMVLRDDRKMICIDLAKNRHPSLVSTNPSHEENE